MPDDEEVILSADVLAYILSRLDELSEDEIEALVKSAAAAYIDGSVEGYQVLSIAVDFDLVHQEALDYTKEYRDMLVNRGGSYCSIPEFDETGAMTRVSRKFLPWAEEYSKAQRELISDTIKTGIQEGQSVQHMADNLSDIFDSRDRRAEILVQTESRKHHIEGIKTRYKKNKVEKVEWSSAGSNVCPLCLQFAGQVYPIDEVPGGGPPLHPTCRCRLIPVIDLESEIAAMEEE